MDIEHSIIESSPKKFAFIRLEAHEFKYNSSSESIGIGYLVSILREEGIETQIFDNTLETNAQLKNHIEKFSPDFLGYTSNHRNTMEVINFDKGLSLDKESITIWGGAHATFSWYDLLKDYEGIDVVVLGEAEKTLPDLIEHFDGGYSLENVKGIAYKTKGKPIFTGYRETIANLDTLPLPARDVLRGHLRKGENKIARILSSRGCVYNCNFCITPSMREVNPGKIYRERNPLLVVDEMESLSKKYGINTFYFNDDLFFTKNSRSRKRSIEIAEELLSRGLKVNYKVELRVDSIDTNKDGDFIALLRKSGLTRVFAGVESGSKKMLNYLNKCITPNQNKKFLRFMAENDIQVEVGKILFGPSTGWEELEKSIKFFHDYSSCVDLLKRPNKRLELFPGTKIYREFANSGLLEEKPSYMPVDYKFNNPKVSNFEKELRTSFSVYYPLLKPFFDRRKVRDTDEDREYRLNETSFSFLNYNVQLKNNWSVEKFGESLEEFTSELENILNDKEGGYQK